MEVRDDATSGQPFLREVLQSVGEDVRPVPLLQRRHVVLPCIGLLR